MFLAGTADPNNPTAVQAHSEHFIPSASGSNQAIINFLTEEIAANIGRTPIAATSSGITMRLVDGVPITTASSPGPLFAERAQTLGRGRVFVAASVNIANFKTLRGVGLKDLSLNFTHTNADFPGCDTIFGGDCTDLGNPQLENDVIALGIDLDLDVIITSFVLTYGLLDQLDIGVAIPIVSTKLRGSSIAQVIPFGDGSGATSAASHFFEGSSTNPDLFAQRTVEGSETGIGDISARAKVFFGQKSNSGFGILADARFPTGSEMDLLGSGNFAFRGIGIISGNFGNFSPHANVGYFYRSGEFQNDGVLATVGFDQIFARWATLMLDLVTEFQVGDNKLPLPQTVFIDQPFRRSVEPTNIPSDRDDIVDLSAGFKFSTDFQLRIVTNVLIPLNNGGLRPDVLWTVGLEYNF